MTGTDRGWTHEYESKPMGSPARVFTALTDPGELRRWFAEHVEIDAHEGGAFRFWGRHSYGAPDPSTAHQRITRFERDRALGFSWRFEGADSEVTVELEPTAPDGEATRTRLALRHAFPAPLDIPYGAELVDDLWRLTLGNLDAHLRGGDGIVLPDYTDPTPEIRMSIVIDAPRERVFRALIEPAALDRWIASGAEVDPKVGGRYRYGWRYPVGERQVEGGPTRILDLVENERLVTDWVDWRGDETRAPTRVAWLLESVGPKTRVTVIHGDFSRVADQSDYPFGWRSFLERLKAAIDSPERLKAASENS